MWGVIAFVVALLAFVFTRTKSKNRDVITKEIANSSKLNGSNCRKCELLIKNGIIFDGSGITPRFKADVAISNGKALPF